MIVTGVILAILTITTTIAAVSTAWTLRRGVPKSVRLQGPNRSPGQFRGRLPLILFNLTLLFAGPACVLPFLERYFSLTPPGLFDLVVGPIVILLFDDTLFYFWHRLLHQNKWLYRTIHRLHHRAVAPVPLDYIYAHPIEWLVGALGPIIGMVSLYLAIGELNAWTFWIFTVCRQLHEINIHSGARSVILNQIPGISSTDSHDTHHARPYDGNFGSIFEHWDRLFNTKS